MSIINFNEIKEELVVFLRNSDIFTTTQRGVTTTNETPTLSAANSWQSSKTNIKNIRSITVDATPLNLKDDYTVDYEDSNGCLVTFTSAQTGDAIISYDYGNSDKIFPDFPRPDLTISSFPRIAVDLIGVDSNAGGFGNVNVSNITFTVVIYDKTQLDINTYLASVRSAFINNFIGFKYLSNYVRPLVVGPIIKSPRETGKDKILQQNIDFVSNFKYEKN